MDPRVLTFLANVNGLTEEEIRVNDCLIRMYISGVVEAHWQNGEPLFSLSVTGREESMIAYAHAQRAIEE